MSIDIQTPKAFDLDQLERRIKETGRKHQANLKKVLRAAADFFGLPQLCDHDPLALLGAMRLAATTLRSQEGMEAAREAGLETLSRLIDVPEKISVDDTQLILVALGAKPKGELAGRLKAFKKVEPRNAGDPTLYYGSSGLKEMRSIAKVSGGTVTRFALPSADTSPPAESATPSTEPTAPLMNTQPGAEGKRVAEEGTLHDEAEVSDKPTIDGSYAAPGHTRAESSSADARNSAVTPARAVHASDHSDRAPRMPASPPDIQIALAEFTKSVRPAS